MNKLFRMATALVAILSILNLAHAIEVNVDAITPMQRTSLYVEKGTTLFFSASGLWSHRDTGSLYGPNGYSYTASTFLLPYSPVGCLIGQIGTSAPFYIGTSASYNCQKSGSLFLSMNDNPPSFFNNRGFLVVTISSDIPTKLAVPANFKAEYGSTDNSILLTWDAVYSADQYIIYMADYASWAIESELTQIHSTTNTEYEFTFDFSPPELQEKWFYIKAIAGDIESFINAYNAQTYGVTRAHAEDTHAQFNERLGESIEMLFGLAYDLIGGVSIYYIEGVPITTWIENKIDETFQGGTVYNKGEYLSHMTACPVDIEICTPEGLRITKTNSVEYGIIYIEGVFLEAGETNDIVIIPTDKAEYYTIEYVPEAGLSNALFSAFSGDQNNAQITISNETTSVTNIVISSHTYLPELYIESASNQLSVTWRQEAPNTNTILQYSADMATWSNVNYLVDEYITEAMLISSQTNSTGFYRLIYQ